MPDTIHIPSPPIPDARAEALVEFVRASALSGCTSLEVSDTGWELTVTTPRPSTGEGVLLGILAAAAQGDDTAAVARFTSGRLGLDDYNHAAAARLVKALGVTA